MRSCRLGGTCARDLAPLHRRRGPHRIRSHAGAGHLISMRSSCLGCMDGMGRVVFPHIRDTLTPGQPHARTCASPDLGVGEEGSRFSIGRGLDLRLIAGWSMSARAGQNMHGRCRARSLTWVDFCPRASPRNAARQAKKLWLRATCSCLLRDHAQEGLLIWRLAKKVPRRRGMTGSKRRGARGRGENAISHIVKKA